MGPGATWPRSGGVQCSERTRDAKGPGHEKAPECLGTVTSARSCCWDLPLMRDAFVVVMHDLLLAWWPRSCGGNHFPKGGSRTQMLGFRFRAWVANGEPHHLTPYYALHQIFGTGTFLPPVAEA